MGSFDIEICSNCGWEIARSEQAYVFEGKIVCAECDNTLRSGPVDEPADTPELSALPEPISTAQSQPEAPSLSVSVEQEKANQGQDADKPVAFIIAGVILCLLGIGLISMGLVSLAVLLLLGMPMFGILMACVCYTAGTLIFISGIVVTVIAVISRQS
ncbi:MAG: hypothetical protein WBC22_18450 [Sedimentisphaerales bacterium]